VREAKDSERRFCFELVTPVLNALDLSNYRNSNECIKQCQTTIWNRGYKRLELL